MIFSSSLGNVEKYTTETAIKSIANHVRKLQDELEYRLSHLDSTNINEIDTDETDLIGGAATQIIQSAEDIAKLQMTEKQISASVESLENSVSSVQVQADGITATVNAQGKSISTLEQTADSIIATVEAQGGSISTLQQTADGLTAIVQTQGQSISTLQQTANSITATVDAQGESISTLEQTASSITSTVQSQGQSIATLQQTASGITATVQAQGQSISTLQQTSDSLTATVTNLGNSMSQTVRLSADGLTITNAAGSKLTIDGGQVNADTLNLTGKIAFTDLDADAQQTINGYDPKAYLQSIGITEITGDGIKSPLIEGGEIRGAEIYGGIFSDLAADNYLLMETTEIPDVHYVRHSMSHYVGTADRGVPVTSIGWASAVKDDGFVETMWYLAILGASVLERRYSTLWGYHMKPNGVWDFSGCTVNFTGANVIGLSPIM